LSEGVSPKLESRLDPWPIQALNATLDLPVEGFDRPTEVPWLWHWLYFLPTTRRSEMGPDGHKVSQEWVNPMLRRRRLFAAARVEFIRPLQVGSPAQMSERVLDRRDKTGRSGTFHVVTVEHHYFQNDVLCIREERDIVYLQGPAPAQPALVKNLSADESEKNPWSFSVTPDPVMLMRYSALTFNSHLIHFDQLYTQREEGYRERVVHGPLVAVMLAQLLAMNKIDRLKRFEFRARSPLFVNQPIHFSGTPREDRVELQAIGSSGMLAMEATAWL
jgi:3-methylfumaryl-CoA hydratase